MQKLLQPVLWLPPFREVAYPIPHTSYIYRSCPKWSRKAALWPLDMILNVHNKPEFGRKFTDVYVVETPRFPVYSVRNWRSGVLAGKVSNLSCFLDYQDPVYRFIHVAPMCCPNPTHVDQPLCSAHLVPLRRGAPHAPWCGHLGWYGGLESSKSWVFNDSLCMIGALVLFR